MTIIVAIVFDVLILFWFGSKVEIIYILAEGLVGLTALLKEGHAGALSSDRPVADRKRSGVTKHRNKAA